MSNADSTDESSTTAAPPVDVPDDLGVYPERQAAEDPRWAIRIVTGWTVFAILCLIFMVALLVLGWFYD